MSSGEKGADADHAAGPGCRSGRESMPGDRIAIPADDGAIQRAFAELDARMDAWLAGMNRAHEALAALAARAAAFGRDEGGEAPEPASHASAAGATAGAPEPAVVEETVNAPLTQAADRAPIEKIVPPTPARTDSQAVEDMVDPPVVAATAAVPAGVPRKSRPAATADTSAPARPAEKVAEPAAERRVPVAGNDEALLASVDPEVAKAIRVRRRLNPNGKSVAELLAEYQANPPAPKTEEPRKKSSWWKRG